MRKSLIVSLLVFCSSPLLSAETPPGESQKTVAELLSLADVKIDGPRPWDITVHNDAFYDRVLGEPSMGLGESYMAAWWDAPAVDQFMFHILSADLESRFKPTWSMKWTILKAKIFNYQDKTGSMEVIDQHYQLGNTLYEKMLGPTMAYSCGYWAHVNNLDAAQLAKYDLICRKLGLTEGMTVLDIGCGWGGFAKYAASHYKAHVTGITLSENQAEFAKKACEGLPVTIRVQDYRDVTEKFDRILEIGMFEHVGPKNYRVFMEMVHNSLNTGGLFMLHTIGGNGPSAAGDPWIDKYIFPNGILPSIAQIGNSIEGLFVMEDWHNFGPDYDKTLMAWFDNFNKNWDSLQADYSPQFYRMWKYYLLSCAGAFRARKIQLWQVVLSKEGIPGGHITVR